MIRNFLAGFNEMMRLTCFRGPWAHQNIAERMATPVETARDFGEWFAAVLVQGEERRKYSSPKGSEAPR